MLPIGTKVKIKDNLNTSHRYNIGVSSAMVKHKGKIHTITGHYREGAYFLNDASYVWSDDTFDVIELDKETLLDMLISGQINQKQYEEALKST